MEGIIDTDKKFDFDELYLTSPSSTNGGNYFIKILKDAKPLYIQPPKCKLKNGIVKTGKRTYCDLMFTNIDENFIEWIENLETLCQERIYENRSKWFDSELEKDDIENSFTAPFKIYKSGKFYIMRATIPNMMGKPNIKIYDETGNNVNTDNVSDEQIIATIIDVQGIKCSARSFQLEFQIKQILTIDEIDIFNTCILNKNNTNENKTTNNVLTSAVEPTDEPTDEPTVVEPTDDDAVEQNNSDEHIDEPDVQNNVANKDTDNNNVATVVLAKNDETDALSIVINTDAKDFSNNLQNNDNDEDLVQDTNDKSENSGIIEDINIESNVNGAVNDLVEIDIKPSDEAQTIFLKKRNDVYYNMYREALKKAKSAKEVALTNYLEAKRIKNTYMLTEINDYSDTDDSIFSDEDE
jgi:hypothetical protein